MPSRIDDFCAFDGSQFYQSVLKARRPASAGADQVQGDDSGGQQSWKVRSRLARRQTPAGLSYDGVHLCTDCASLERAVG